MKELLGDDALIPITADLSSSASNCAAPHEPDSGSSEFDYLKISLDLQTSHALPLNNNTNKLGSPSKRVHYSLADLVKNDLAENLKKLDGPNSSKNPHLNLFNVAVIGGGGAGTVISSILSNLSDTDGPVKFRITIFERSDDIIDNSAFSTAAVMHGGREYAKDPETAADCRMASGIFKKMLPRIYKKKKAIVFAINPKSNLKKRTRDATYEKAKEICLSSEAPPLKRVISNSQNEIPTKTMEEWFPAAKDGVLSKSDTPMNIIERNALLRKFVSQSPHIEVQNNFTVGRISKDSEGYFTVLDDKKQKHPTKFNHVIVTAWDQSETILANSSNMNNDYELTNGDDEEEIYENRDSDKKSSGDIPLNLFVEDRVMAICDIEGIPVSHQIPILTLTEGAMFVPITAKIAIICGCQKGATYPKGEETHINAEDLFSHGEKIIEEVRAILGKDQEIKLLGVRKQRIVTTTKNKLNMRRYLEPKCTSNGIIVAIPPKATYIGALALQVLDLILEQLPETSTSFKKEWQTEINKIVSKDKKICSSKELPTAFKIDIPQDLIADEINAEIFRFLNSFELNDDGKILSLHYQNALKDPSPTSVRSRSNSDHRAKSFFDSQQKTIERSVSTPLTQTFRASCSLQTSPSVLELTLQNSSPPAQVTLTNEDES